MILWSYWPIIICTWQLWFNMRMNSSITIQSMELISIIRL